MSTRFDLKGWAGKVKNNDQIRCTDINETIFLINTDRKRYLEGIRNSVSSSELVPIICNIENSLMVHYSDSMAKYRPFIYHEMADITYSGTINVNINHLTSPSPSILLMTNAH